MSPKITACACVLATLTTLAVLTGCHTSPQAKETNALKRGATFLAKKDYSRALLEFRNASQAMPNDAEPYYQMGLSYSGLADIRGAAAAFRRATELNPKHAGAQLKLSEMLMASRNKAMIEEASKRLEAVLANAPGNTEANDTLAIAQWELGQSQDAATRLEETLAELPGRLKSIGDFSQNETECPGLSGGGRRPPEGCGKRAAIAAGCLGPRAILLAFKAAAEGGNGD